MKKFLILTISALFNFAQTIALDATLSLIYWLVLTYIVDFPFLSYQQVFGLTYICGVGLRHAAPWFKSDGSPLVYQYKKVNGKDYLFASKVSVFTHDVDLHEAMKKGVRDAKLHSHEAVKRELG